MTKTNNQFYVYSQDLPNSETVPAAPAGEKIVIINPTDLASIAPFGEVTYDLFLKLGLNVEIAETDWGTVIQRRASRESVDKGGWSVFHTWWTGASTATPVVSAPLRGQGGTG